MASKNTPISKKPTRKAPPRWQTWLTVDRIIIGGSLLLTFVIVGVLAISSAQNGYNRNIEIEGVEIISGLSAGHTTETVNYRQTPPAGGEHHPRWQQCGVYSEPVKNEHAVHSLEHGVIWITYQPDLPADEVNKLADITRRSSHRLLSPFPGIDSPIVLTAWGYQLALDSADDPRLMQFILKYEQGPDTPELGATCSGGVTQTASQLQAG